MARIDDPTIHNPFGWRLADLADPATSPQRRSDLLDELVVCEAEELAHGLRHLTVVHGDPTDVDAARHLAVFYNTLRVLAAGGGWVRVRGTEEWVTVAAAAHAANPRHWTLTLAASPASR